MPNCKKSEQLHTRNSLAQSWINFNQWLLRNCHFRVYAIFSNGPWWPSWIVNLHKFEIVPFKILKTTSCKKQSGTKLYQFQPTVLEVLSFLCYAIFSNGSCWPS